MGGKKGSSMSHYMVEFVNYILYNQDLNIPHAVLAVMVDFSKPFNRTIIASLPYSVGWVYQHGYSG